MAQKRMFTMKIVDSDAFLDMPLSTQCLYFHLNMRADDDGFIGNPKKIMRMIGASEDDLKILLAKRFLIIFEDSVVVVKHWWMHNTLAKDRYHETSYTDEKALLKIKENKAYTLGPDGNDVKMLTDCKQNVNSDLDIDIVLDKEKEQAQIPPAPAYVQEPLKTNKDEFQSFLSDAFVQILNHNKYAKHKIPISNNLLYFTQKEGRQLLELSRQYETKDLESALKNYLMVANSDTWKSGFSFNAFCKNIAEYIPEYFDLTKYIDLPKGGLDELAEKTVNEMIEKRFVFRISVFYNHKEEWFKMGMPKGQELVEIVNKWTEEEGGEK
jgi:hypothetical protein